MKKEMKNILLAVASAMAIFLDTSLFKIIKDIDYSIFYNMNIIIMSIITILFYFVYKKNKEKKIPKLEYGLAIFFAICMIIGEAFVSEGTLGLVFTNIVTILFSIIKLIGYTKFFSIALYYLDIGISKINFKEKKIKSKKLKWYVEKLEKYPFRTSFITIFIVWSLYIIAFYPLVLSPDPSFQIRQYFNVPTKYIDWVIQRDPNVFMTSHHPVTQTFLLGWCIEFGRSIINDNFGLFCYTLLQSIINISVFAYTIKFAKNNGLANKFCLLLLGLYLFVPMYGFYNVSAVKDTLYTAFMILYILFLYDIVENYKDKKISAKYVIFIVLVMLLLSLFRHNGAYVVILSLPFAFFYSKQNRIRILIAFTTFFLSLYGFNHVLVPALGISGGSVREMLSVPFQQTARYVKYHEDEVSEEDKEIIDYILDYDTLVKRYKPEISDPVKNEFNKNTSIEDLKKYFKVWGKGLLKHPETYIDATLHNIYGYFYPNSHNWYIYSTYDQRVTKNHLVDFHFNHQLGFMRNILTVYGNIFPYLPGIGLFSSIGANTWALCILAIYVIVNKKKKYLIVLCPMFISILFCVISPVNTYFRYTMPYIFPLPVITLLCVKSIRGVKDEKK